ncbi:MAG: c-type cytochrome [Steroidobacteraceae bacterium]
MKTTIRVLGGALLCGLLSQHVQAQTVPHNAELARGEHVARLICATCHVVAKDQEFPPMLNQPVPSFLDIANRPGVTAESLRRFITSTHWDSDKLPMTMPNPMLMPEQTRAVARYILSLRHH